MDEDEARRIADELLERERQKNARGWSGRVPFLVRSADSRCLERQREWELLRQARRNVFSTWGTSVAVVSAPVALGFLFSIFARHPAHASYVVAWLIALLIPNGLVVFHLRRELAKLARAEK
jgi:hypothetical protein